MLEEDLPGFSLKRLLEIDNPRAAIIALQICANIINCLSQRTHGCSVIIGIMQQLTVSQ